MLGGIERNTDKCFLVTCPGNKRDAASLIPIIKEFIQPGTTILTDMWKSYLNLDSHGYIHHDVNHSRSFVDPSTGAHTNTLLHCAQHQETLIDALNSTVFPAAGPTSIHQRARCRLR